MLHRPTVANIILAFRQAKVAVAAERDAVGLSAFAAFELGLYDRARVLQGALGHQRWFDGLSIGGVVVCPRTSSERPAQQGDVVRVGPTAPSNIQLAVRLQLEPTPEFAIAEVLYLWEFGGALESLLDNSCVGYRLKRVKEDGAMDRLSRDVYEYWPEAFRRYRDDPVDVATLALKRGERVLVTSTDVTSFFDSIDPSFLLSEHFISRLEQAASHVEPNTFSAKRFRKATESLLAQYTRYRSLRAAVGANDESSRGVPIGSLVSRVIANVALAGFDKHVQSQPGVLLYRRYVDDIVIVSKTSETLARSQILSLILPGFSESASGDDTFVVPDTGMQFNLKRSKTRIHDLEGATGVDFLEAVQASFSAVTSERRAFIGDVERLTSEIEGLELFEDGHENMSRVPRLRDADRFTLRRYIASSLIAGLERCALLLDTGAAISYLRLHTQRLLAIANTELETEDFGLALDLLRVALMCGAEGVADELDAWLLQRIMDLKTKATGFLWKGRLLPKPLAAEAVEAYLTRRVEEAKARSCSWSGDAPRGGQSLGRAALALRMADLRHLDRECDLSLFGSPSLQSNVQPVLPTTASLRDTDLSKRLKAIRTFLDRASQLGDEAWSGMSEVSLLLSVRPPSYADVAWRFLAGLESGDNFQDVGQEINACVDALRGTRYSKMRQPGIAIRISDLAVTLDITESDEQPEVVRVVLSSLPVSLDSYKRSVTGQPDLSLQRLSALDRALRDARDAARRARRQGMPSLLLMPELALPRKWLRAMMAFASREQLAIVTGVEYQRGPHGVAYNQAVGIFPLHRRGAAVVTWTKRNPARHESLHLHNLADLTLSTPLKFQKRLVVDGLQGRFGVLICSELLEASALSALSGHIEMLLVPAWNDDLGSFDHLAHAAGSALVHSFVCVANNAEASDARVVAPVKEPRHERDWCRLIQRGESRVVWADVPTGQLRRFHDSMGSSTSSGRMFRPLPPDWPKV